MRVAITAPVISINGGIKQTLLLGEALAENGFDVDLVTPAPERLRAFRYRGKSILPEEAIDKAPYDVAVVTWYQTYDIASKLSNNLVHFSQGYEGNSAHPSQSRECIERIYGKGMPTLTVSQYLAQYLSDAFGTLCLVQAPLLDPLFKPRWGRRKSHSVPTILHHGTMGSVKNVPLALQSVAAYRRSGAARLFRVSGLPRSEEEPVLDERDRYFDQVEPAEVARITADCDLTLLTSTAHEGFGLPVLESLAAGVPVVAVRIPSLAVFETLDVVETAPEPDPEALAEAMNRVLRDPARWRRARRRGLEFARLWRRRQNERAAETFLKLLSVSDSASVNRHS